jgi:putative ATPase
MKEIGYGADYKYSHGYDNNFSEQEYLPDGVKGMTFYEPGNNAREKEIRENLKKLWGKKYGY